MNIKLLPALLLIVSAGFLSACEKEGPMEKAGETIDSTVEQAKDKIDDAGQGPMEQAGEAVDESVEKAKEKMNNN